MSAPQSQRATAPSQFRSTLPNQKLLLPYPVQRAAEDGREAFQQYRALKEAALRGTGLEQWQLLGLLGDGIEDSLLRELAAELDELLDAYTAKIVRTV